MIKEERQHYLLKELYESQNFEFYTNDKLYLSDNDLKKVKIYEYSVNMIHREFKPCKICEVLVETLENGRCEVCNNLDVEEIEQIENAENKFETLKSLIY